ncbi:MAG: SpoIIE family protein phosphatase [Terracidiphilus sp.]
MALAACAAAAYPAQPAASARRAPETMVIDNFGKSSVPLDGMWQFHTGDDPAWAAPGFDDSNWEQIAVDQPWGSQGHKGYTGSAWYRLRINVSTAPGTNPEFALLFQNVDGPYEVYWNGLLIGRNGSLPPHPVWYWDQPAQTYGLGNIQSGVLAVRTWKSPLLSADYFQSGGMQAPPLVGTPEGIGLRKSLTDLRWLRVSQLSFGLATLYGLVALLSMLAWLRDRRHWIFFWTAGIFLVNPIDTLLDGMRIRLPYTLLFGVVQIVLAFGEVSLWFLLLWVLDLKANRTLVRWTRTFSVMIFTFCGLDAILVMFFLDSPHVQAVQIADALFSIQILLGALAPILVLYALVRRRKLGYARWLVALFAFANEMLNLVYNFSSQGQRFTGWTLSTTLATPLFEVNHNPITAFTLAQGLLLLSVLHAVARDAAENRHRQHVLEQEFQNARELQQVLVPETPPTLEGFNVTSAYKPAQEVGGDFFQIIPLEGDAAGSTLVVLGDVSGKGLRASMAVSLIVGSIRMAADSSSSPGQVLAALNRRLYGRLSGGFVTCLVMRLDPGGLCTVATAGHPSPFLNGEELSLPGAFPLGLIAQASYEETTVELREGDHLDLYTDGLLEARSAAGEIYGFDRMKSLFATRPTAAEATDAAIAFGQDDDITVLTLTRLAVGEESSTTHTSPALKPAGLKSAALKPT